MDLVLGTGTLTNERSAPRDPAAQTRRLCVGDPNLSIPAASNSASVRASKRSDFTRA